MCRPFFSGTCLFMLLGVSTAAAQTEKGSKLIGVTLGGASYAQFTSTNIIDNTAMDIVSERTGNSYAISVGPSVGWFVKDDLAVGAAIGVSYSQASVDLSDNYSNITQTITMTTPRVLVSPFARYYFGGSSSAKPFAGASASLIFAPAHVKGSSSVNTESEIRITPKGSYAAGLTVGYEQFLSKSVGLVFSSGVSYSYSKIEARTTNQSPGFTDTQTSTQTDKAWTIPFNVGLEIHFQ